MKAGLQGRADRMMTWLAAALLCLLAGHAPAQGVAADQEALVALSNTQLTGDIPSSFSNPGMSSALFVPVILTASGLNNSYYTSELTLTNRGSGTATLRYTYTAAAGEGKRHGLGDSGSRQAEDRPRHCRLSQEPGHPHSRYRKSDRDASGGGFGICRGGRYGADHHESGRGAGRSGLSGDCRGCRIRGSSLSVWAAPERTGSLQRRLPAHGNAGGRTDHFEGQRCFLGIRDISERHVLEERILVPGGFHQYNAILNLAGFDNGYVKVERVGGTAPFYAYGVINDQANSDGSFVFPVSAKVHWRERGDRLCRSSSNTRTSAAN